MSEALDGPLGARRARPGSVARVVTLTLHLARRELDATHRNTLLGWAWPLARQLVQLAVLVFIFGSVLDLGIEDYPLFVFCGLVAWSWFSTGVTTGTSSLLSGRHLLFQPRFPALALPLVALAVPLLDVALALPVLLALVAVEVGLRPDVLALPALLVLQGVLMCGLVWLTSAASVFLRDVPNLVGVALLLLFYLTPVFYGLRNVPADYQWLLELNPMTTIVEAYRALLLGAPGPSLGRLLAVAGFSAALAGAGLLLFRRVEHRFVDEL